jgi:hypothetical protein
MSSYSYCLQRLVNAVQSMAAVATTPGVVEQTPYNRVKADW